MRQRPRTFRIATGVMLVLFASWAGFQYNDPDALVWLAVYVSAAIHCALFLLGRFPRLLAWPFITLCVFWALYLGLRVGFAREFLFDERGREMFGLLICAGWTYVLDRNAQSTLTAGIARHS